MLVVKRGGNDVDMVSGRDLWWHELMPAPQPTARPRSRGRKPLFLLYTSGTTGKPKGILHTTGGYLTQASSTHKNVFDHHPYSDIYWCTADIGWITGHTYINDGPLSNAATTLIYEGTPNPPPRGRWWAIIEKTG